MHDSLDSAMHNFIMVACTFALGWVVCFALGGDLLKEGEETLPVCPAVSQADHCFAIELFFSALVIVERPRPWTGRILGHIFRDRVFDRARGSFGQKTASKLKNQSRVPPR